MARERVRALVLCEDRKQESFLRAILKGLRIEDVRSEVAPRGKGSAEQWVRLRFPDQARAFRSQAPHQANLVLLVATDGDAMGGVARKATLDQSLESKGHVARSPDERIAYMVPTWSIETWLAWLSGQSSQLDGFAETKRFKDDPTYRRLEETKVVSTKLAAAAWAAPRAGEAKTLPSLADARRELQRVPA